MTRRFSLPLLAGLAAACVPTWYWCRWMAFAPTGPTCRSSKLITKSLELENPAGVDGSFSVMESAYRN